MSKIKTIPERFAEMKTDLLVMCFDELQELNRTSILPNGLFRSVIGGFSQDIGQSTTSFLTSGEKDLYFELARRYVASGII